MHFLFPYPPLSPLLSTVHNDEDRELSNIERVTLTLLQPTIYLQGARVSLCIILYTFMHSSPPYFIQRTTMKMVSYANTVARCPLACRSPDGSPPLATAKKETEYTLPRPRAKQRRSNSPASSAGLFAWVLCWSPVSSPPGFLLRYLNS